MSDEDRIIAGFSDAELLLWHAKFGTERLNRFQRGRLADLLDAHARELAPPDRRLSPSEWAAAKGLRRADESRERIAEATFAA